MMRISTTVCLSLVALGVAGTRTAAAPYKIVMFGDSTTAPRGVGPKLNGRPGKGMSSRGLNDAKNTVTQVGHKDKYLYVYADRVRDVLPGYLKNREIVVYNEGIGKNNTAHAVARLQKDVRAKKPDLVVIQYGINDSAHDGGPGTPSRVPLDRAEQYGADDQPDGGDDHVYAARGNFESNLTEVVTTLLGDGCDVILMTPNRVTDYRTVTNERLSKYADVTRKVAAAQRVPLVDVWKHYTELIARKENPKVKLLLDVAHPNGNGHDLVAELLIPVIVNRMRAKSLEPVSSAPTGGN